MSYFDLDDIIFDDGWGGRDESIPLPFDLNSYSFNSNNCFLRESTDFSLEADIDSQIQELEDIYNEDLEKFRATDDEALKDQIKSHALQIHDEIEQLKSNAIKANDEKALNEFDVEYVRNKIKGKSISEIAKLIVSESGNLQISYKNLHPDATDEDLHEISTIVKETYFNVLGIKEKPTCGYYKDDNGDIFQFTPVEAFVQSKANDSLLYKPDNESSADVILQARHYEGDDNTVFYRNNGNYKRVSKIEAIRSLPKWDTLGGVSKGEEKVIQTYSHFTPHNKFLRNGGNIEELSDAKKLKDIIDHTNSGSGIFYRGVTESYAEELREKNIGDIIIDKGFVSTSTDIETAENFTGKSGLIMKIISKGGPGKCISVGAYSEYTEESEYLFNTNTRMKIINKTENMIEVEVL